MAGQNWGTVTIKVTPEDLKAKAAEVSARIRNLEDLFSGLESDIQGTRSFWIGEGGDLHRKAYLDQKENLAVMIRRLKEHPIDLLQISGNYEAAEKEIQAEAAGLQVDAIS